MWKRRLSIFILVVILVASLNWEPTPVKSAAPVQIFMPYIRNTFPVVVSESRCMGQKNSFDWAIVRGNVMNISDRPVYNVTIQADFYDSTGQVISSTGHTVFTPTLSMQRNPFEIGGGFKFDNVADCTAKILSWTRESSAEFLPLTVVYTDTHIPTTVSALFRNDNQVPLKNVIAYAWSLNQYYSFDTPPRKDLIAPGETITYTEYFPYGDPPFYVLGMGSVDP